MAKHRIELLDSFRFIAITAVIFYHFFSEVPPAYPYGDVLKPAFNYGYLGVEFFFMISGFVISYTLENTPDMGSFYRNRFSRLFPAMLLCSLITFITCSLLDNHNLFRYAHEIKSLVPGLTFINPSLWTLVTHIKFHWINGSYWSLWVEVQFYIISSAVYFLSKKNFFTNMLLAGIAVNLVKYLPGILNDHFEKWGLHGWSGFFTGWGYGDEVFNIDFFILWFLPGVVFYQLYKGLRFTQNVFPAMLSGIVVLCLLKEIRTYMSTAFYPTVIAFGIMVVFFLLMIYRKKYLLFLANPLFTRIGVISYSIYLIHEIIGVLLINKYGGYLGRFSVLSPLIVIALATCFAELSYRLYEKKAAVFLKRIFSKQ